MSREDQGSGKCWENGSIFHCVKVILEISLSPPAGPPVIDICYSQENFEQTFGFINSLPMSLDHLISRANDPQEVASLTRAILIGASHSTFLSLRDAKGTNLACHVQVAMGNKVDNRISPSSSEPRGILRDHMTTMTIRSASMVGNTKAINVLVDPSLVDSTHPSFDMTRQQRIIGALSDQIDKNTTSTAKPKANAAPQRSALSTSTTTTTASTTTTDSNDTL